MTTTITHGRALTDSTLRIRLTARERAALERAAGKVPVSTWARRLLLAAAGAEPDDTRARALGQAVRAGAPAGAAMAALRPRAKR